MARTLFTGTHGGWVWRWAADGCLQGTAAAGRRACTLFSGPWPSSASLSFYTCMHGIMQSIVADTEGPLTSQQEEMVTG